MARMRKYNDITGFTLIEVVIVIASIGIVTLGIGVLLANSQKNWGQLFERVYGDSATDSFALQRAFDTVCRKASLRKYELSSSADALELYYCVAGSTASTPENYARFYQNGDRAQAQYGLLQTGTWQPDTSTSTRTVTLASNIQSLEFTVEGMSAQLFLTYLDSDIPPIVFSSVRHND